MKWLLLVSILVSVKGILAEDAPKKAGAPAPAEAKKAEAPSAKAPAEKTAEKPTTEKVADKKAGEKPAGEKAQNENSLFPEKEVYTKAEVEALKEVLDKKSNQLDQDIDAQVKYLEALKVQTEEHLKKIEVARNEIADFMNTRDEKEEGKLKKLARFYEAMDAEQAAPLLKDVADDLAIKIFDRMDTKKAGAILAQIPAARAARLTAAFPKLKLQVDRTQTEAKQ
ncbi:MAG: hypothetical protein JWQ35_1756 [Bacteriovoracaceae bacterium]|nr:hypothetical protein [Bacteriovoracaceae bacterium]